MEKSTKQKKWFVKNVCSVAGLGLFILLSSLFNNQQVMGSATGPLTVHPTNPRYFADGTGEAIYLTGSHSWYFFQDWSASDRYPLVFDELVNLLKTNHHNFVRGWAWRSTYLNWGDGITIETPLYKRTGPGTAWDGKPKFNLNEFNEEFFTRLRERIIQFGDNGIYVSMMMFCGVAEDSGDTWESHSFDINNNINNIDGDVDNDGTGKELYDLNVLNTQRPEILELHKAFVRKMVDTLGDLDNVIWEIGNEMGENTIDFQNYFIDYIRDYEAGKLKQHPIGFTSLEYTIPNDALFNSDAEWISPQRMDSADQNYAFDPPANDGSKIILSDTDHLSGIVFPWNPYVERYKQWAWKSFTRGLNTILMDDPLTMWDVLQIHALPDARRYIGHTLYYAERVDIALMTPQNSLSSTEYCLANPGFQYIIYQPNSGSFSVNMAAGHYFYEWFNPEVGIMEESGTIDVADGNINFTPPFSGDAVLYLSTSFSASPFPSFISQTEWVLEYVDSEETVGADAAAVNSFDGNPDTIWHTEWYSSDPVHPHEIQIDLGERYNICQFRYLPRQNDGLGGENGMIKDYKFYVSDDPRDWGSAVASGHFMSSKRERAVLFNAKRGRYVRLMATSEINGEAWTTVAELNLLSSPGELADLNEDGMVNLEDFAVLAGWWQDDDACVEPDWCGGSDFDRSGTIDLFDLTTFTESWLE